MSDRKSGKQQLSRRGFMAGAGLAGLGTLLGTGSALAQEPQTTATAANAVPDGAKVPTRPFGKTGQDVAILSLGGIFDIVNNQLMLRKALDLGITYWDTANGYTGGRSEEGIGNYLEKFPDVRKELFIVTKSGKRDPKGLTEHLELSLRRMKTDYVDLFFVHGISGIEEVKGAEVKEWADRMKKEKKIRFFGFSTHKNMEQCLAGAPELGYIDGIMMTYNYRLMHTDAMKSAVDACAKAGIGLTAMKTQGGGPVSTDSEEELRLAGRFLQKGMTQFQAKLKAVWENEQIAAICSQMPNLTLLTANTQAALDGRKLTAGDWSALRHHADATSSAYCAGCAMNCESAEGCGMGIADAMRVMMYHTSYGDTHQARMAFMELPEPVRASLATMNLAEASRACPRGIDVAGVVRGALETLA